MIVLCKNTNFIWSNSVIRGKWVMIQNPVLERHAPTGFSDLQHKQLSLLGEHKTWLVWGTGGLDSDTPDAQLLGWTAGWVKSPVFQSVDVHLLLLTALLRRLLVADFPPDSLQRALFSLLNRDKPFLHDRSANKVNKIGCFSAGTFVRGMSVGIVAPSLDKSRFSSSVSTISLNWNCDDK